MVLLDTTKNTFLFQHFTQGGIFACLIAIVVVRWRARVRGPVVTDAELFLSDIRASPPHQGNRYVSSMVSRNYHSRVETSFKA